jgi:hypothetical protein
MSESMPSYKILQPKIVYEVLNNEVVAIDFNTGTYYVLPHAAKQVWLLIERKTPSDQIAQRLSDHYQREFNEVFADTEKFIAQLLENGLIEPTHEAPDSIDTPMDSQGWQYGPPKLLTYMDVQDLLLLDPIHEVTEVGWPDKL